MRYVRSGTRANPWRSIRSCEWSTAVRSVLGKPKLAARTPVVVAALRALAVGWRSDARARDMLSLALGSSDPDTSAGCAGAPSMSDPAGFLNSFAQALAVMTLYPDGHPSRERAIDAAYLALEGLPSADGHPSFTFLDNEVVYGRERLRDFREWDWGSRLVAAGIQRLEFERKVTPGRVRGVSAGGPCPADAVGRSTRLRAGRCVRSASVSAPLVCRVRPRGPPKHPVSRRWI